ncbi:DUF2625 family protein [Pseudoclavibacter alba]|uniref:DUF2625 family protein n=1 Tax=Pseudoclavibacter albus TaxID=272241 RepID=UPI0019D19494|nr:DUF2625 family protein [Pseudoclavibacter alba]MBN6777595.1 DUF2625 family protein [Pseudoclavibacter alba]
MPLSPNPAWPELERQMTASHARAAIIPVRETSQTFEVTGLSERSALGALAKHTGGVLLADGWIRLFGGVGAPTTGPGLPSLDEANERGAGLYIVGIDVLGGVYAIDGGAFERADGQLHYWAPDTLDWTDLEAGLHTFISAMLDGHDHEFYEGLRWTGWEAETATLALDEGIHVYPLLCTRESKPLEKASRRAVPMAELVAFNVDLATQIDGQAPRSCPHYRPAPPTP